MRGRSQLTSVLLVAVCSAVGCRLVDWGTTVGLRPPPQSTVHPPAVSADDRPQGGLEFRDGLVRLLAHDTWNANSKWSVVSAWDGRTGSQSMLPDLRWRLGAGDAHNWLDDQQRTLGDRALEAELRKLSRRNDLVGYNAAIIWAQRSPATAEAACGVLLKLSGPAPPSYRVVSAEADTATGQADNRPRRIVVSPAMRAAAAEAWCRLLSQRTGDVQQRLLEPARVLRHGRLPPLVTAEFYLGLSRCVPPDLVPRLPESLGVAGGNAAAAIPQLRIAALRGCVMYALWNVYSDSSSRSGPVAESAAKSANSPQLWPESIWDCQWEDDAEIKSLFGLWIALVRLPGALETLEDQLLDLRPDVRHAAIVSLGFLETDAARVVLLRQAESSSVRMRAEAVRSLSRWGASSLEPFLQDEAAEVRAAAVSGLRSDPNPRSLLQIRRALTDDHSLVQQAAVEVLSDVPDHLALSLLFHGLQESQFRARKACWHAITGRLGRAFPFPINKPLAQRREAARAAAKTLQLRPAVLEMVLKQGLRTSEPRDPQRRDEVRRRVEMVLSSASADQNQQHVALERMRQLTISDVPLIESAVSWPDPRAEILFQQTLPHLHPVYAALADWQAASDVGQRRRFAAELLAQSRRYSLSPLMLERLLQLMRREQDRQIWNHVHDVVASQPDPEGSQRIVQLMLNQPSASLRRMGCAWVSQHAERFVVAHGQWIHAVWLHPLLEDADARVQLAAVQAAGHCGHPALLEDIHGRDGIGVHRGLRTLYDQATGDLRFAVALSMSRLGDRRGAQELMLLTRAQRSRDRLQAVQAIGESGQPAVYVPDLIGLLEVEPQQQVRTAVLQSLGKLVPENEQPQELELIINQKKKADVWRRWLDESGQRPILNGSRRVWSS